MRYENDVFEIPFEELRKFYEIGLKFQFFFESRAPRDRPVWIEKTET
jgi:hypothetical protein